MSCATPRSVAVGLLLVAAVVIGTPAAVGAGPATQATALERPDLAHGPGLAIPPVPGRLLRPFQAPSHDYGPGHRGVDLAALEGQPVQAALAGTVTFAGPVAGVGWVTVAHGAELSTTYGDVVAVVTRGQPVARGATIGHLALERTHLDWGARTPTGYIDPLLLLVRWQVHLAAPDTIATGVLLRL